MTALWAKRERFGRLATVMLLAFLVALLSPGLSTSGAQAAEPDPVEWEHPEPGSLPQEVDQWVDSFKERQGLYRLDHDGITWVLVAWGAKPTGGYVVEVQEINRTESGVVLLTVELAAPKPGDIVTQAISYPYDLVKMEQVDEPLAAEFHGAPWLPTEQEGTPLVSRSVFIQEPTPGTKVGSRLRIRGAAQLFEGTFHVVLEDGHFQLVNALGTASAGGPEWGAIDLEVDVPTPSSPNGTLIIMWQDPQDGNWVEELAVPVTFENFAPIDGEQAPEPVELTDIAGHWAESAIAAAVGRGYVNGYPDGTFRPDNRTTRAEFLKMLLEAFGIKPAVNTGTPAFNDSAQHWAGRYVDEAVRLGIVLPSEYGNIWQPDREVTRLEMAAQAIRTLDRSLDPIQYADQAGVFTDTAGLSAESRGYIGAALEFGIFTGYPDGTFGADRTATRAEAVTVIQRALAAQQNSTGGAGPSADDQGS